MIQCKHFFMGGGKNATPKKGNYISLRLIATLAAFTATFAACSNNEDAPQQNAGTQPALRVALNNPASRALITDAYLPEGAEIGFSLTGAGGSTYDGTVYSNLAYVATGTGASQTWATNSGVTAPSLSSTKGTAYAYYPYTADATDFTAIPVSVSAESQTDWMYATPVTGVNGAKADINLTMNHAMTAVRLSFASDAASPYTGEGVISSVTVTSDGLGTAGTLNATTGAVTATDAGTGITLSGLALSLADSPVQDIIFLPAGTAGDIEITLTVDGNEYITTAPSVTALQGYIYNYVVKIGNTGASVAVSTVNPWSNAFAEVPELEVAPKDPWNLPNGVYAVSADGRPVTYDDADNTCIAVALVVGEHKFWIEKNEASNTSYATANDSYESSYDYDYYFSWGGYGTDQADIPTYNQVGGNSSSLTWGYLPKADGSYASTPNLSGDITTWTDGTALGDFNGKENSESIKNILNNGSGNNYYTPMGVLLNTFNEFSNTENFGYTDWYIPACGQLALMWLNMAEINTALTAIGGTTISSNIYWSSSEFSSYDGWYVSFGTGLVDDNIKDNFYRVRLVRDL